MSNVPPLGEGRGSWRREPGASVGQTYPLPEGMTFPFAIVAESHVVGVSTEWEPHAHLAHELVWVRNGTLTARIAGRVFTISEGFGLWVPAGEMHSGRLTAKVELYDAFFSPEHTPSIFDGPTVVSMVPVLQSLLIHLGRRDLDPEARTRAEAVVLDVLEPSERQLAVQLPDDAKVDAIAEALLDDPADERSLDEWARVTGMSSRTITRAFRATTGLSFAQWRQAVRIHRALELLAEGLAVQEVSDHLGYAHPGTFIEAFRRVMGTTPGVFRVP